MVNGSTHLTEAIFFNGRIFYQSFAMREGIYDLQAVMNAHSALVAFPLDILL